MPLSLHPLRERNTTPKHKNRFWKILKKFLNLLEIQKNDLPLHPLRWGAISKKVLKIFWKILSKSFGGSKNNTYLCTTFRWKIKRSEQGKRSQDPAPWEIREIVLIVIYWTAFFEVFEQLKVFSTLAREWFQTIPLRLELKIYNKTFFTMESLILAQDER